MVLFVRFLRNLQCAFPSVRYVGQVHPSYPTRLKQERALPTIVLALTRCAGTHETDFESP